MNPFDVTWTENSTPVQLGANSRRAGTTVNSAPTRGLEDASSVRLFYEVLVPGSSTPVVQGILCPARLIAGLFELHFVGLHAVGSGRAYVAQVWATDPAPLNLRVRAAEGEPAEGALGFLVYDQALEGLASTEASIASVNYQTIDPTADRNAGFGV